MAQPNFPNARAALPACLLAAAGLLGACGGGGSPAESTGTAMTSEAAQDAKASALPAAALAFTAPGDGADAFDVGAAVGVAVEAPGAEDGDSVVFSAGTAAILPVAAPVRAGTASASFTASIPGPQVISATLASSSGAASALRTVYARPAPAPLEVLVPAYFYPSEGSPWDALSAGARAYPGVAVTAILNPDNGVFKRANPEFAAAAGTFVQSGGRLLGYVYTRYGARSASTVKRNIDSYLQLYGRGLISGFFIDEMSTSPKRLAYYLDLYTYIKARDAGLRVVGNPGTQTTSGYLAAADTLVNFENRSPAFASYDPRADGGWLYQVANTRQAALLHDAPDCAAMQQAVRAAAAPRSNAGMLYVTDGQFNPDTGEGDPWDTLPGYWLRFLGTVDAVNRGATLPTC
ncbi:spherulation-specific family 4 protein [Paracidovorax oryzae]|uniref:spherulation-specific family 4 protein n=1 Tax=Paracidovorax oryzae TaxID=862720 RepID=UPI0002FFE4EB|nr:spherulation-specific family 4 protein [Paracidovorax oryzae]